MLSSYIFYTTGDVARCGNVILCANAPMVFITARSKIELQENWAQGRMSGCGRGDKGRIPPLVAVARQPTNVRYRETPMLI
jgi:hypothetical protein